MANKQEIMKAIEARHGRHAAAPGATMTYAGAVKLTEPAKQL